MAVDEQPEVVRLTALAARAAQALAGTAGEVETVVVVTALEALEAAGAGVLVGSQAMAVEARTLLQVTPLTTKALTVLVQAALAGSAAAPPGMLVVVSRFRHH